MTGLVDKYRNLRTLRSVVKNTQGVSKLNINKVRVHVDLYERTEKSYLSYYLALNTVAFSQNNLMLLIFEKWATLNPTFVFKCSHII